VSRDEKYLAGLRDYYARYRVIPSFSTIAHQVGLSSSSSVAALVDRLKAAGFLSSTPERRLIPVPRFFEREVVDSIRAGRPAGANDAPLQALTIDGYLVEVPSRSVLLRVRGDSMNDAGILDGDTVVVLKGAPASVGDIVIAIVDGEYTVKYLAHDGNGFFLKPANSAHADLHARDTLELFGVVVASFRKYAKR